VTAEQNAAGLEFIRPDWPAPANVHALSTTRAGGVSRGVYQGLNLAMHVADNEADVAQNRALLGKALALPGEPLWLNQVHGTRVLAAQDAGEPDFDLSADAARSQQPGQVCAVLTADCLPLLFCDRAGTRVASAHAGWRGLLAGVINSTIAALALPGDELMVWLGPAIGPGAFAVGADVYSAFLARHSDYTPAFVQTDVSHWLCDVYLLARIELHQAGVSQIYGGGYCTWSDARRFYSYRRDGDTGRMASLIWLE
jgi:hypothetical protein